jgi:hypothetical protein
MISQYHSLPAAVDLGLPGKLITELKKLEKRIVWRFRKSLHGGRGFAKRTPDPKP